jgi:hypothetical protein
MIMYKVTSSTLHGIPICFKLFIQTGQKAVQIHSWYPILCCEQMPKNGILFYLRVYKNILIVTKEGQVFGAHWFTSKTVASCGFTFPNPINSSS